MRNKIIYTVTLVSLVSCSNFKPYVLTNAYLDPVTTTQVTYNQLNFQNALFNQYASGLTYSMRLNYSNFYNAQVNNSFILYTPTGNFAYTAWDTITATYAEETNFDTTWTDRINFILFGRQFERATDLADRTYKMEFFKHALDNVNLEFILKSKISYKVNIGSVYMAFQNLVNANVDNINIFLELYNNDVKLQDILLTQDRTFTRRDYLFDLTTVVTNVNEFRFKFQYVDTPPFANGVSWMDIYELNLFTQNSQISIPDDAGGDRFGFEFVAVEWWNILGHLQNFIWWIVNKSPVAPVFEFIDEYVITWISGLIDLITGVFNI